MQRCPGGIVGAPQVVGRLIYREPENRAGGEGVDGLTGAGLLRPFGPFAHFPSNCGAVGTHGRRKERNGA